MCPKKVNHFCYSTIFKCQNCKVGFILRDANSDGTFDQFQNNSSVEPQGFSTQQAGI